MLLFLVSVISIQLDDHACLDLLLSLFLWKNGHLMDGFTHLEDQWPGWMVDGDDRSVLLFICVFVMYGGDLD